MPRSGQYDKPLRGSCVRRPRALAVTALVFAAAAALPLVPSVAAETISSPVPAVSPAQSTATTLARMASNTSFVDCVRRPTTAPLPPPLRKQAAAATVPSLPRTATPCDAGQIAQPRGVVADNQAPLGPEGGAPSTTSSPRSSPQGEQAGVGVCDARPVGELQYYYAGAYQDIVSEGTQAYLDQPQPCLATSDLHSMAQIAVHSADKRQTVQMGWTVDRLLSGDTVPHLFVHHWVDGQPTCYNGCGYVQVSSTRRPGMPLSVTSTPQEYSILSYQGNWWIGYQSEWIGYFPGSLWNNTFSTTGVVQWFGEVQASTSQPCTDMGTGEPATATSGGQISNISYFGTATAPAIIVRPAGPYYGASSAGPTAIRYGGPGAC